MSHLYGIKLPTSAVMNRKQRSNLIDAYLLAYEDWHRDEPDTYLPPDQRRQQLEALNNSELFKAIQDDLGESAWS